MHPITSQSELSNSSYAIFPQTLARGKKDDGLDIIRMEVVILTWEHDRLNLMDVDSHHGLNRLEKI